MSVREDREMADEVKTKIGKRSYVSLEVAVLAIVTVATIATTTNALKNAIQKNSEAISSWGIQMDTFANGQKEMSATLDEILIVNRVQNELTKVQTGDRWTAGMEADQEEGWKRLIRDLHPDVDWNDFPDVRETQKAHGFSK